MTPDALPLTPPVFAILNAIIEERIGLHYGLEDRAILAEKVTPRALELGFDSLLDYYYFLRYDPGGAAEFHALTDGLVVNETYFFREPAPLRLLADQLLAPMVAEGRRPRVWCAACSTGEEPLTLAMMLDERGLLDEVDLVASDLSERALGVARRGVYGKRATRALPAGVIGRWLEQQGAEVAAAERLQQAISWRKVNLLDPEATAALGCFDAILCRNVLIYFRGKMVKSVVARLGGALLPTGWLLVGISESLLRFGTEFTCEERAGVFLYRKADP